MNNRSSCPIWRLLKTNWSKSITNTRCSTQLRRKINPKMISWWIYKRRGLWTWRVSRRWTARIRAIWSTKRRWLVILMKLPTSWKSRKRMCQDRRLTRCLPDLRLVPLDHWVRETTIIWFRQTMYDLKTSTSTPSSKQIHQATTLAS